MALFSTEFKMFYDLGTTRFLRAKGVAPFYEGKLYLFLVFVCFQMIFYEKRGSDSWFCGIQLSAAKGVVVPKLTFFMISDEFDASHALSWLTICR